MGNYMQGQHSILLENVRAKYRATDEYIQANRHQSLQKRFPGEVNELMLEADKHLQEAEYLLPALANRLTQKIVRIRTSPSRSPIRKIAENATAEGNPAGRGLGICRRRGPANMQTCKSTRRRPRRRPDGADCTGFCSAFPRKRCFPRGLCR